MKLSHISLQGFRGVRDRLDLAVDSGFLVLTGRNGSGKSTVCDAVEFVLTGTLSRFESSKEHGESIADYLWWRGEGGPRDRFVRVTFQRADGEPLTITRRPDTTTADIALKHAANFCRQGAPTLDWPADLVRTMFLHTCPKQH